MNDHSGADGLPTFGLVDPRASAPMATVLGRIRTLAII